MDSLRHERMGLITSEDDSVIMLAQAYVKTDETDDMGAYDPIEGMSRPFPYLATTDSKTVYVENFIEQNELNPVSEKIIEYTSHLYESARNQGWVDEIEDYEDDMFNHVEQQLASSLFTYTVNERPKTLWRMMYESANDYMNRENTNNGLFTNPLRDIEGKEWYNFAYLPSPDDVDSWELKHYHADFDEGKSHVHAESLWLQYTIGDTTEERPLIIMKNKDSVCMAMSPSVSYGDKSNNAPESLISAILEEDTSYDSTLVTENISELDGTKTLQFLKNY